MEDPMTDRTTTSTLEGAGALTDQERERIDA
jgi:hypothetical protein